MKIITFILLFLLPVASVTTSHEFHISKCEIDYNKSEKALQVTLHIFLDDLELSIEQQMAEKLFLCTKKETANADSLFFRYLKDNFKIKLNEKTTEMNWIGKEISEDLAAVWCYIEIPVPQEIASIEVQNSIILNVYEDQKNIVQLKGGGKSGYFMLQRGSDSKTITF